MSGGIREVSFPGIRTVSAPPIREVSAALVNGTVLPPPAAQPGLLGRIGERTKLSSREVAFAWARELRLPLSTRVVVAEVVGLHAGDVIEFGVDELFGVMISEREFMYAAYGVVRRGFIDLARPAVHRDKDGMVVNTFVRHGKAHPPKGTSYLAGELVAAVLR